MIDLSKLLKPLFVGLVHLTLHVHFSYSRKIFEFSESSQNLNVIFSHATWRLTYNIYYYIQYLHPIILWSVKICIWSASKKLWLHHNTGYIWCQGIHCFMHVIFARMGLPFFKIFSNFAEIFEYFTHFFWKIACMLLPSRIGPDAVSYLAVWWQTCHCSEPFYIFSTFC